MKNAADLPFDAVSATNDAKGLLESVGLRDSFTVKVKPFPKHKASWYALYRGMSQFRSRPIFWLNDQIPRLLSNKGISPGVLGTFTADCILHEYAHVIAEFGKVRCPEIDRLIQSGFKNEEDFAEGFIAWVRYFDLADKYDPIVDLFAANALETLRSFAA